MGSLITKFLDKKIKNHDKYKFKDLFLEGHNYNKCLDIKYEKESNDEESDYDKTREGDISSAQPLEDYKEEVK